MHWIIGPFKKYAVWQGRAQRAEYWYFVLFTLLANIALTMIDAVAGTLDQQTGYGLLSGLFALLVFLPSLAVFVRRLHDTGRSGWWFWLGLIPLIGAIVLLVFMCLDSDPESNDYGPSPKHSGTAPELAA